MGKKDNLKAFFLGIDNNTSVTSFNKPQATVSWKMESVIPNPTCVKHFFKSLELKGISLTDFARGKGVNRSKLSQILHALYVPKTPKQRKFWAEEVLGYDVQIFWLLEERKNDIQNK